MPVGSGALSAENDPRTRNTQFSNGGNMVRVGKLGRYPTIGSQRLPLPFCSVVAGALLASCNSATVRLRQRMGNQLDILDKVRSLDIMPRQPQPVNAATTTNNPAKAAADP